MPVYQYRREDGSTFEVRQKFTDDPLTIDPATGQHVVRVIQAAGVIFKGSGFYINDSKTASKASTTSVAKKDSDSSADSAKSDTAAPAAEKATEKAAPAAEAAPAPKKEVSAAAD